MVEHEGIIKYKCDWTQSGFISDEDISEINACRKKLYRLGLIGAYEDGTGFGNISIRYGNSKSFIITGTSTGCLKSLQKCHYSYVQDYDFNKNYLKCTGEVKASSESLTHAIVYACDNSINSVIHIHSLNLWKNLIHRVPTTNIHALYGTLEMVDEFIGLYKEKTLKKEKILVMGGHEEGLIAFGKDLDEAENIILKYYYSSIP